MWTSGIVLYHDGSRSVARVLKIADRLKEPLRGKACNVKHKPIPPPGKGVVRRNQPVLSFDVYFTKCLKIRCSANRPAPLIRHDICCKGWQIRVEVESKLQRRDEWHSLPKAGLGRQQQLLRWA
ncbi:hypothetical protein [Brucella sp. 191011898]|uniref:hypothetical protein n=2 Tax=Brucella/Ochrobactrum group TaxID=2826938 RepID=UPI001FCE6452|nr:hypothetical protein [Brucella sp. 191011898]